MKKQRIIIWLGILAVMLLAGCHTKKEESKKGPFLFYVNADGTALKRESYTIKEGTSEEAVKTMLKELSKPQEDIGIQAPIPQGVKVEGFKLEENKLYLDMNEKYLDMNDVQEMLCRASIVQTLTQVEGVDLVEFSINGEPLLRKNGETVGALSAGSFVKDTGTALKSYQRTTLTLFFANEKGDGLIAEKKDVRYISNVSTEKLVIEQLMKGPGNKKANPILSSQVKIINVSVKDGICYVNFDKQFLERVYDVEPKVVIYGIVNSILSNGNVSRVQISVGGETALSYQESIKLNEPFERNLELVESE